MGQRRVLITGSSGVVGSAIAHELTGAGWTVVGWDSRPGRWTTHRADLREEALGRRIVQTVDSVVHTAALHAPHVGRVPESEFWSVKFHATDLLLRWAAENGVRRFVHTSSTSVYGHALEASGRAVWVDEQLPPRPRDVYDETKLAAEKLVTGRAGVGLPTVVLRIARCFAEPPAVKAAHRLHRGVALADVARAHRLALQQDGVGGIFTIAGPYVFERCDTERLWSDARALLAERAPRLVALFRRQGWPLPKRIDRVYDSNEARRQLGYVPTRDAESVLCE